MHKARIELSASGTVSDITEQDVQAITAAVANSAAVPVSAVNVNVVAASVLIIAEVLTTSESEAATVMDRLLVDLGSPDAATRTLAAASVEVVAAPTIYTLAEVVNVKAEAADSSIMGATVLSQALGRSTDDSGSSPAVIIAIAAVVGLVGVAACFYTRSHCKGRRAQTHGRTNSRSRMVSVSSTSLGAVVDMFGSSKRESDGDADRVTTTCASSIAMPA